MREMMGKIGLEDSYYVYSIESHAIHGDWVDLEKNYLSRDEGLFFPNFEENITDIRKLNPMLMVVYKTLKEYLVYMPDHGFQVDIMRKILANDEELIQNFDCMHFNFLHGIPLLSNTCWEE